MKNVGIIERDTTITIDGYSNKKTIKGAVKDLAKEVAKYNAGEAESLVDYIDDIITNLVTSDNTTNEFYVLCEETPDGNFYLCINLIK